MGFERGGRERLPKKRRGVIYEIVIRGQEGRRKAFVTLGCYADGRVGEIFLTTAKDGTELKTALGTFAIMASLAIQHGMPIQNVALTFRGVRSNPGILECELVPALNGHPCGSLWDAVARLIEEEVDSDGYHKDLRQPDRVTILKGVVCEWSTGGSPACPEPARKDDRFCAKHREHRDELQKSMAETAAALECPCENTGWISPGQACPDHPPSEESEPLPEEAA